MSAPQGHCSAKGSGISGLGLPLPTFGHISRLTANKCGRVAQPPLLEGSRETLSAFACHFRLSASKPLYQCLRCLDQSSQRHLFHITIQLPFFANAYETVTPDDTTKPYSRRNGFCMGKRMEIVEDGFLVHIFKY